MNRRANPFTGKRWENFRSDQKSNDQISFYINNKVQNAALVKPFWDAQRIPLLQNIGEAIRIRF